MSTNPVNEAQWWELKKFLHIAVGTKMISWRDADYIEQNEGFDDLPDYDYYEECARLWKACFEGVPVKEVMKTHFFIKSLNSQRARNHAGNGAFGQWPAHNEGESMHTSEYDRGYDNHGYDADYQADGGGERDFVRNRSKAPWAFFDPEIGEWVEFYKMSEMDDRAKLMVDLGMLIDSEGFWLKPLPKFWEQFTDGAVRDSPALRARLDRAGRVVINSFINHQLENSPANWSKLVQIILYLLAEADNQPLGHPLEEVLEIGQSMFETVMKTNSLLVRSVIREMRKTNAMTTQTNAPTQTYGSKKAQQQQKAKTRQKGQMSAEAKASQARKASMKAAKRTGACFNCHKTGHVSRDCPHPKQN